MTRFTELGHALTEALSEYSGSVKGVIQATPADTAVEIVLFRDPADGVWVAHPLGGPWPEGLSTDTLPIASGSDPVQVVATLLAMPAHPVQEVR
ncbi:hypothetical protein [Deinococcus aerius]|uniref:hypothetical protein n=1 Tax=Deinococcus aerius TaxID=200253 RepID=UPI0010574193|nr:hypothetical protein [Deinococcus aerius]